MENQIKYVNLTVDNEESCMAFKSLKYVSLGELMPYYWGKAYDHETHM